MTALKKFYNSNDTKGIYNDPFFQEFNLLFRNSHVHDSKFEPFGSNFKMPYPIDAWFNDDVYVFEIPIIKGKLEDVSITRESDVLRIKYTRTNKDADVNCKYVTKGIIQRDFDLVWKIPAKFDRSKISSTFENGLLSIFIPFAETAKPEEIKVIDVSKQLETGCN